MRATRLLQVKPIILVVNTGFGIFSIDDKGGINDSKRQSKAARVQVSTASD